MKFIEIQDLEQINAALEFDTPDCKVIGGCDIYTTKAAGGDKKLYKSIDKQLNAALHTDALALSASLSPPTHFSPPNGMLSTSVPGGKQRGATATAALFSAPSSLDSALGAASPFGPLDQVSSRRTFAYLVAVLNASHPDHDFSSLRPVDFKRERSASQAVNAFNNTLFAVGMPVPPRLWEIVDSHMDLKDCVIYSHTPPPSFLADEPGTIWSMMWFFFSRRRKRVCYLFLRGRRHTYSPSNRRKHRGDSDDDDEEDDDISLMDDEDDDYFNASEADDDDEGAVDEDEDEDEDGDDMELYISDDEVVGDLELDLQ
ncbi:Maf1 regulator-domain-containing protein [Limtongia smithiae]|uniref:Maf1 regulator-domain-containing protein n=1 Tax=Limtongia smithiae TaxID=1125753 RepID=UPI0034CEA04A